VRNVGHSMATDYKRRISAIAPDQTMPAAFERCASSGGRIRTKSLSGGQYMHICYNKGKSYAGETHSRKSGPAPRVRKATRRRR